MARIHLSRSLVAIAWVVGENIPVNIERSNLASLDTSTNLTSAGSLFPAFMKSTSPGTISVATSVTCAPSRSTRQLSGNIVVMEAMTRDDDQSCQALKPAWMKKTARRTMARARFASAGGLPAHIVLVDSC